MRFKIDWASLTVGRKFTVFALFYFEFEGNFPSTSPPEGLHLVGRFNGGFFALPDWGAYTWRGFFFRNFTVSFDALWKFLWPGKSSLDFWGVKFWSRDCLGFCLKP